MDFGFNTIKNKINEWGKQLFNLLPVLCPATLVLSLLPILILSKYNVACIDDWGFSAYSKWVWEDTHSVLLVFKQALLTMMDRYYTWQGNYSASFFAALQPGIWNYKFYGITTAIILGILLYSIWYFLSFIFNTWIECDKKITRTIFCVLAIYIVQMMPSPVEGFFWYNGAFGYMFFNSLLLILIVNISKIIMAQGKNYVGSTVVDFVLIILIAGGNYITSLACAIYLTIAFVLSLVLKRRRIIISSSYVLFAICFVISLTAPGKTMRAVNNMNQISAFKAIILSFPTCMKQIESWMGWEFAGCFLLIIMIITPAINRGKKCINPVLLFTMSGCLLASLFTPAIYGIGNTQAGRIQNIIFIAFALISLINVINTIIWIKNNFEIKKKYTMEYSNAILVVSLCMILVLGGFRCIGEGTQYTSLAACWEMVSGQARVYEQENEEREQLLTGGKETVKLKKHKATPLLLYTGDITEDTNDWTNQHMCRYYRVNEVYLDESN